MSQGIVVRDVAKRFGSVTALAGVTVEVPRGSIVALLGPNGAGKSTLLRILATTVAPDAGELLLDGVDAVREPAEARRRLGLLLTEERSFFWRLTGRQNLEFFGALHGLSRRAARRRADELLAEVDLLEPADRPVSGYSAGMSLRLALARALLSRPSILLLDEPTRSLDVVAARELRERMVLAARREEMAILLATHDLHEAASVAERIVVLRRGAVEAVLPGPLTAEALERALTAPVVTELDPAL